MFLTTEVTETCQDQDVKVGLERLSPYYRKIYFSSKMIAKNPLDNLMSFVAGYFQSLLQVKKNRFQLLNWLNTKRGSKEGSNF